MAEWKKIIVSGSSISQLNNDAGYISAIGGGIFSASIQIDHDQTTNFSADEHFTQANITTVGTVTAGSVTAILPSGTVSGSSQIVLQNADKTGFTGASSITTLGTVTSGDVSAILPAGTVSGSALGSGNQGEVYLTTNGVAASPIDLGLQTSDSPSFAGLTLSSLSNQAAEATAVVINGSNVVGTRELGSNAFTSTAYLPTAGGSISGNLIVGGDLTVNGSVTNVNTIDLNIEDKFILLNSGSSSGNSGIIVQNSTTIGQGTALFYDDTENRWGIDAAGADAIADTATADAYVAAVVTSDVAAYQKNGNIRVEGGEIYIYVE